MSVDTFLNAATAREGAPKRALVLMGGGARTAYQVGVLQAIAAMLRQRPSAPKTFPFQILVGTSAGALNATFLAGCATRGLDAFEELATFWQRTRSRDVYSLKISRWARWLDSRSRLAAAFNLSRNIRRQGALLDSLPLVDTLHRAISLPGIEASLASGTIDVLAVTASSYTSGIHWTFCHTLKDTTGRTWKRPGRMVDFQPITIEHLMASSAIPFIFPSTPLWVDEHCEFFGDGSMRQISPLSPAVHLGAQQVLVVGVSQPQRAAFTAQTVGKSPGLGGIAGHAMASVFHDTLQADVEQALRINKTIATLPPGIADTLDLHPLDVLAIQPSQSLDALAQEHTGELPATLRQALRGLGALDHRTGGGAALASYLLFEPAFVHALIALGHQDAYARKDRLMAFFSDDGNGA